MLVTFPHMGNAYIAMKSVLEDLGVDVLVPPPCTKPGAWCKHSRNWPAYR